MKHLILSTAMASMCALAMLPMAAMAEDAVVVNVDNFDKAQTDHEFEGIVKMAGGINKLHSNRTPTPVERPLSPIAVIQLLPGE